ncbi:MAG: hypothetical protein ACYSWU_24815 [Planctomycetota bacterium]|jgi:hypothetical protein
MKAYAHSTRGLQWLHTLPLKDIWTWWETAKEQSHPQELGRRVAERIRKQPWFEDYDELDDFAGQFELVEDIDEFDDVLEELYDWADVDKRCWVKTF